VRERDNQQSTSATSATCGFSAFEVREREVRLCGVLGGSKLVRERVCYFLLEQASEIESVLFFVRAS